MTHNVPANKLQKEKVMTHNSCTLWENMYWVGNNDIYNSFQIYNNGYNL